MQTEVNKSKSILHAISFILSNKYHVFGKINPVKFMHFFPICKEIEKFILHEVKLKIYFQSQSANKWQIAIF